MFDKFTDRAKMAMARANNAAAEFGHADLTPQHVLVGILREGESVATTVLDRLEVDREAVLSQTIALLRGQTSVFSVSGKVTTHGVNGVVADAIAMARELGADHVGSEHLLLAVARAQMTPASQLLTRFSVTGKRVVAVLRGMGSGARESGAAPGSAGEGLPMPVRRESAAVGLKPIGGCPLCDRLRSEDRLVVADLSLARVVLGDNQGCAGWCVLLLKSHIEHLDVLPVELQAALFGEVAAVARAIRSVFAKSGAGGGSPRINYECLGNQAAHIHWHVIPRHADDPDPRNAVWGWPVERLKGSMTGAEREELAKRIGAVLREAK